MFTCFHKILPWHLPFKNAICNIVVAINFYIFELKPPGSLLATDRS